MLSELKESGTKDDEIKMRIIIGKKIIIAEITITVTTMIMMLSLIRLVPYSSLSYLLLVYEIVFPVTHYHSVNK